MPTSAVKNRQKNVCTNQVFYLFKHIFFNTGTRFSKNKKGSAANRSRKLKDNKLIFYLSMYTDGAVQNFQHIVSGERERERRIQIFELELNINKKHSISSGKFRFEELERYAG